MRGRRVHVHIDRLVTDGGLAPRALTRALARALERSVARTELTGHPAAPAVLHVDSGGSAREMGAAIGRAIGRSLSGAAGKKSPGGGAR